jgi:hypothetical protein
MRRPLIAILLLAAAGCQLPDKNEDPRAQAFAAAESASGLIGTFEHLRGVTGVLVLDSGLKVYLPHFDQVLEGDDWFKYVGKRCYAHGILHTYTKDIEGFRGPSLELNDFSGPGE